MAEPYVEVQAAGPLVDVTVFGGFMTASITPEEAKNHGRELVDAAEEAEGWAAGDDSPAGPGLAIRIGADGPYFEVTRPDG